MTLARTLDVATSVLATIARGGAGMRVGAIGKRPAQPLVVYEFEACPFCRKVREALTELDLSVEIRPCPKRGRRFRPDVIAQGGKAQFPYLVDPNTGRAMYESDDIVRYLFAEYGAGDPPARLLGPLAAASGSLASAWRARKGSAMRASRTPAQPLTLWSFEASPYCRIVRETLCELELPYLLHNVGRGSSQREGFVQRAGKMRVPYLADPNTGRELFESAEIVRYLEETYRA